MKKYITKYEWRWAVVFSVFSILWAILEVELGWHNDGIGHHKYLTLLFLLPAALIYFLFFKDKKSRRYKRRFKFKHIFWSGMGLTLLIVAMSIPCQFFIHSWISSDFIEDLKNNVVTDHLLSRSFVVRYFYVENFVILFALLYFFMGLFFSIVFGFTLRKERKRKTRKAKW